MSGCVHTPSPAQPDWVTVVRQSSKAVVSLIDASDRRVVGSGFLVDARGLIVTDPQNIRSGRKVRVQFSDGVTYMAMRTGPDSKARIAVLRLQHYANEGRLPLALNLETNIERGNPVAVVGAPCGLPLVVTTGIATGATSRRQPAPMYLRHTATLYPGTAGSPLLDVTG